MSPEALRAIALDAWRRAELGEQRARVAIEQAAAAKQRASQAAQQAAQELETLTVKTSALQTELKRVRELLSAANKERFGSKDEGRDRTDGEHRAREKKPRRKQTGHGPTPQPLLPLVDVVQVLAANECSCAKCQGDLRAMGEQFEETTLVSAVEVHYEVKLHKQQKYRCGDCGHLVTAPGPLRLIPGGRYDLSFVVQVVSAKHLDHLPLERQVTRMAWCTLHVRPWRVRGQGGRRASAKWWMWTLRTALGVLYTIVPTRGAAGAKEVLRDLDGVLMADGYSVYASLEGALTKQGGAQFDLETQAPEVLPDYTLAGC